MLRLQGDLGNGITIDNTAYTYAYVNKTLSTTIGQQTAADIAKGITEGNGTIVNGVTFTNDVPGYTKQNAYRVWGNIFRACRGFRFRLADRPGARRRVVGKLRHPARALRFRRHPMLCLDRQLQSLARPAAFADSSACWPGDQTSAAFGGGFFEYEEHSSWNQYQPFVELELHPLEDLTITPGFKYVWWNH